METDTLRKTNRIVSFNIKKRKRSFLVINFLLFIGSVTIVSTLLYILIHLNQSDKIIYMCVPIIATGLIFVLFYAIGYHELTRKENSHKPFQMKFMSKFRPQ
jgi:putative flippase GtrA